MRCRPGDIAVTVGFRSGFPEHTGQIVDVLYAAPSCEHTLPNGVLACGNDDAVARWVIRLRQPVRLLCRDGTQRLSFYAVCRDANLQPIRGVEAPESVTTTAPELAHAEA